MSYLAVAQAEYKKNQNSSSGDIDDPYELIELTLSTLLKSLKVLSCDNLTDEAANRHITRSLTAIYLLQDSIDVDKGGDLALNLLNVYEHCRLKVLEYSSKRDIELIENCIELIDIILESWKTCKDR